MSKSNSPTKKRKREEEECPEDKPTKRQRLDDGELKRAVEDEGSEEFDPEGKQGDDSYDSDIDNEESGNQDVEADFDLEHYKKWRE